MSSDRATLTPRGAAQPRNGWPTWLRSIWHNWFFYSKTWRSGVATSFLQPVMYLAAMGLGVGALVNKSSGGVDGVPYLDFVAPGLLAASMLQIGVNECTYPVMGGLKWVKSYFAKVAAPLSVADVVIGHLGWLALRCLMVASAYFIVMVAFGAVAAPIGILVIPAAALSAMSTAAPTAAWAARQEDDTSFALLFRLGVLPMFLFSGIFYPVSRLPGWLQPVAQLSPLTHGADLCRSLTLDAGFGLHTVVDLAYLSAFCIVGVVASLRSFRKVLVV